METVRCHSNRAKKKDTTRQIDDILIHKYFGILIFLFLMWGLFQITFELGAIPICFSKT
jgi:ferrous iron transport protein B